MYYYETTKNLSNTTITVPFDAIKNVPGMVLTKNKSLHMKVVIF